MKTTFLKTVLGLLITLNSSLALAQAWIPVGDTDFPYTEYSTLVLDNNDTPYIFYKNYFEDNIGFVVKFENDSWNSVGEGGLTETIYPGPGTAVGWKTHTLALNSNNIPHVAYVNTDGELAVKKFENNQWQFIGEEAISPVSATAISLAFDNNNVPYVSYVDWNINSLVVKRFEDNNWLYVGSTVSTNLLVLSSKIAFDNNNKLYIVYTGKEGLWSQNSITLKKNENNNWEDVGTIITTEQDNIFDVALAIDNQNIPYVAYNQSFNTILVKKFAENDWQTIGEVESSSENHHIFDSFAIDNTNIPYISYTTINLTNNSHIATIKKYENSLWQIFDVTNQFNGVSSITFDSNNIPYAVFTTTGSTTVRKFDPTAGIDNHAQQSISMYPNPTSGILYIETSQAFQSYEVYNLIGQRLLKGNVTGSIDIKDLSKGTYIIRLITQGGAVITEKIIKE